MAQNLMTVHDVAAALHVSAREVVRMAERGILPALEVKGEWHFRPGEVYNWIEKNLHILPEHRSRDRHPAASGDLLIGPRLVEAGVAVDVSAKTRASLLRELAELAAAVDPYIDAAALAEDLGEREARGSTALQDGVAVPHPAGTVYAEGPVLAAIRTAQPIVFGERDGGLTDLFFLVCCPDQTEHLLYLGRLCRLLIDKGLQAELRAAESAGAFVAAMRAAEEKLCGE